MIGSSWLPIGHGFGPAGRQGHRNLEQNLKQTKCMDYWWTMINDWRLMFDKWILLIDYRRFMIGYWLLMSDYGVSMFIIDNQILINIATL